ncbi:MULTISPECIES: SWIM zinc finger family protein [unclassified Parabacteroides]|uniref:SWIM zinc finger family protein n=1 Tax=unclassified Parabacteroides TaxID=2649774 RepID=UPI0024747ED8|nr:MULTISPECIES: SWIM zinc finger family protein [unclassified Parabacteroides]MDH6322787.1 hypothetical protein [Parabacteroides sp. PH5-8]MDH6393557.1 hypothetical protein [Parabacteroides sp. PFB2-22]
MSDTITYLYREASELTRKEKESNLFLSKYSEIQKPTEAPCFFWGNLKNPYMLARCLVTLSNVVQTTFHLSVIELRRLRDPIVTAGNEKLRFEGFSHCAGAYARVDVLPDGLDGEFLESGTTNVDFNPPMIAALSSVRESDNLLLSVGSKELALHKEGRKIVERKVPLPAQWIKGLTSVQLYLSEAEEVHTFNKIEALKLFQGIPRAQVKSDYYLITRGGRPMFSPVKSAEAICVGGLHRLRLVEPLLPYIDKLKVFPHPTMQSTTWQLYFGAIRFSYTLSRDTWRGFSGEGAALESLIEDIPDGLLEAMDKYSYANQEFNPTLFAMREQLEVELADNLTGRLAAMGLLGFDLDDNRFFYRQLPYKLERILGLNPRLKGAVKLLAEGKVMIISQTADRTEARVEGSGVSHTVIINREQARCTCAWYSKYQGERGLCKHVLAVKKLLNT